MNQAARMTDHFTMYSTATACADAAAPIFQQKKWRWWHCGIPTREQILDSLRRMEREGRGSSGRLVYYEGRFGHEKYTPFNRKTFDPVSSSDDKTYLSALRRIGRRRLLEYGASGVGFCSCSQAFGAVAGMPNSGSGIYLDLGCGDSPDVLIAASWGFEAFGLDLFPPSSPRLLPHFKYADVAERLPFDDDTVSAASSHAMVDLIEPNARDGFFREVFRVFKRGGKLAIQITPLKHGHGINVSTERQRAILVGFKANRSFTNGFVVSKP